MMVFILYVPILLSLCLSFLFHVFKKHIHLFLLDLVTPFNNTTNTIMVDNNYNKLLHPKSPSTTVHMHVLDSPPSVKQIGFIDDVGEGIEEGLVTCTASLSFQSIDDINFKEIHDDNNRDEDEDEDDCWRRMSVAEGRGNFPPPLSSLNGKGQPSFILVPARKNGRLQLSRVRIKRPKILYATRQDGRLRLFLVPDQCVEDYPEEEEEEEEEVSEDVEEGVMIVESMEEEEDEEEIMSSYEQKDTRVGEWKFPNERFRKCHEILNRIQGHHHHGHGSHHYLHIYGFSMA